jgi:opacity protein-like surface antigen
MRRCVVSLAFLVTTACAACANRATVTVLGLAAQGDATRVEAIQLSNRLVTLLKSVGQLEVMPRLDANRYLAAAGLGVANGAWTYNSATRAGRALGLDYVVFGSISRQNDVYRLTTAAVSIRDTDAKREQTTVCSGDWQALFEESPIANLHGLPGVSPDEPDNGNPADAEEGAAQADTRAGMPQAVPRSARNDTPGHVIPGQARNRLARKSAGAVLAKHLYVGVRSTFTELESPNRKSFLGTIDRLDETHNIAPIRVCVGWQINPWWGVEGSMDELTAWANTRPNGFADGSYEITSHILVLTGRVPNWSRFAPGLGVGVGFYDGEFNTQDWWQYGYHTPTQWTDAGSPLVPQGGITQEITLKDSFGAVVQGGCEFAIVSHLSVEFLVRYTYLEMKSNHKVYLNGQELFANTKRKRLPFSHTTFGLGARYTF